MHNKTLWIIALGILSQVALALGWVFTANELDNNLFKNGILAIYLFSIIFFLFKLDTAKNTFLFFTTSSLIGAPLSIFALLKLYPGIFHDETLPDNPILALLFSFEKSMLIGILYLVLTTLFLLYKKFYKRY